MMVVLFSSAPRPTGLQTPLQESVFSVLHLHVHLSLLSSFSLVLEIYTTIGAIALHLRGQKHCSLSRTILH